MSNKFDPNNKTCAEKGCIRLYGNHCHARDNGKFLLFGGREYPDCEFFEAKKKPSLFDRITQSPEVLAEFLVFRDFMTGMWTSLTGIEKCCSFTEAIAATVAKLKEVAE
jgi:hypothetical protein